MTTSPGRRGCGDRKKGGIYAECGMSDVGKPLEDFLVDPPALVAPDELGLAPVGMRPFKADDRVHLLDWVGEQHYPNVADFLEEVRRMGLSRRMGPGMPFGRLTAGSTILLVHRRAHIVDASPYRSAWTTIEWLERLWGGTCPKRLPGHALTVDDASLMCAGAWWQDLVVPGVTSAAEGGRLVDRAMPAFTYEAALRPPGVEPEYLPAVFAAFPVTNLAVVRDPEGATHEQALEATEGCGLPVDLVEE